MKGVRGQRSVSGLRRCTSCISPPREDSGIRDCGVMRINEWKPLLEVFQGNCWASSVV